MMSGGWLKHLSNNDPPPERRSDRHWTDFRSTFLALGGAAPGTGSCCCWWGLVDYFFTGRTVLRGLEQAATCGGWPRWCDGCRSPRSVGAQGVALQVVQLHAWSAAEEELWSSRSTVHGCRCLSGLSSTVRSFSFLYLSITLPEEI